MSRIPSAIIFDWDNTLVDSWITIHHALSVTFEEMGRTPWTLEEAKQRVRASARDSFPALFGEEADRATRIFYDTYEAAHLEVLTPMAGAEALLSRLVENGVFLAIVSNKNGDILRREVKHLGWERFFGKAIGATDAAEDKPSPIVVELALEGSGVELGGLDLSERVWFVGDTDIDLRCAHNAGCHPVLVRPEAPADGEFTDAAPARHFRDCHELIALLS